jgi:hypothetical protein
MYAAAPRIPLALLVLGAIYKQATPALLILGALAGHLGKAHVRPTLEVVLIESPAHLQKVYDPESGLALIRPSKT